MGSPTRAGALPVFGSSSGGLQSAADRGRVDVDERENSGDVLISRSKPRELTTPLALSHGSVAPLGNQLDRVAPRCRRSSGLASNGFGGMMPA
ncbi:hypothetical protein ACMHYB_22750 [Sorangium sp. So ce1128]